MMMEEEKEDGVHSAEPPQVEVVKTKYDTEETKRLYLLRSTIEAQDPSYKGIDDATLRRFLRARDLNVEKASKMLSKYISWNRAFIPRGFISTSEVSNEILQNKMFRQGTDKKGRPIGVMMLSKHFPSKGNFDECKRYMVFTLDKLCSRMNEGQEKFTIIADLDGYGYCNIDVRASIASISILQDYYPERLGKVFIIHVPYVFMTMWKVISPFIDKNTKKKIVFVENNRLEATLLEDIDESQLPDIYGGKLQLVPIHHC